VEFLDKPSKSDENREIASGLQERDIPVSILTSYTKGKRMRYLSLFIACILLGACSVHYGPRVPGFVPGYVDSRLGENTYQIKIGEAWPRDWPDLEKFAMYRASEITQERGLRYFVVTHASTQTTSYAINTPTTTNTTGTANVYGNTAYINTTSTTTGGTSANISGGWYILDFKVLSESDLTEYEKVVDSKAVMSDLKYFIDARR